MICKCANHVPVKKKIEYKRGHSSLLVTCGECGRLIGHFSGKTRMETVDSHLELIQRGKQSNGERRQHYDRK